MSAAVPSSELTSAFGEHEAWQWRAHLGQLCDPLAAAELYGLKHDADGTLRLSDRQLVVPVCLYIAVDDSGACLYIGQCRRRVGGVVNRITGHHAIPPHATGLWVLPVRADCPPAALDRVEARMIGTYTPPYNTAHCPPDRREQRPAEPTAAHQTRAGTVTATAPSAATTTTMPDAVPVTPCAPAAVVEFIANRFGLQLADRLDPASRPATTRAARTLELRRCGQLRDAERYGWLSLTGWLLGLPATVIGRIDPTTEALGRRAGARDLLPEPLAADPDPVAADVAGTGLLVHDPRDPLGWHVLRLATAALGAGVVDVGGRRLGGGPVAAALTARLQEAGRG